MLREGLFWPTASFAIVDPRCAELDDVTGASRRLEAEYLMSNNFAFGGVSTSLIFRRA